MMTGSELLENWLLFRRSGLLVVAHVIVERWFGCSFVSQGESWLGVARPSCASLAASLH